jgi:hypothetical protein
MLALDLFNTKYEQDLQEGAVDDLEARRIDTLNDRMQDLLARAKEPAYQANPAALAALKKQFQQVKDERDSYYKVREAGIPGNVPTEKIPGKEDLLKGKGRSYYEDQKKNSEAVDEHGGGIGPRQHWQDLMPEQLNPEDDDWYDDEDPETELRSGDYVRDTMDGESGEVFRMQGDPYERRVRILDRDGKGWYIEPSRLTRVDPRDPDVQRYFGKKRVRDMDEAIVASGPSKPLDDRAVKKLVWDTMKINADSGEQAIQRALSVLAKKPQSRMVQDLQDKFQNLADRLAQGVAEGWSDRAVAQRTGSPRTPYSVYIKGRKWKDFENDDLARAVADKLRAKFKADGRDPETITIAPTDYDQPIKEDNDSEAVERAILNRIMVAHTDLLMKFGPDKVMQAAEEVSYNVGDVDEIGTSDVSAYVAQVRQILGAVDETQVNEKWSAKYKSSINCADPKGFSQKAHCAGKKK